MGIARGAARLLLAEAGRRPFHGSVLQLGRQRIYLTMKELRECARLHDFTLAPPRAAGTVGDDREPIDDVAFFSALGFSSVESLDISDYQGSTHIADLNRPVPESLHGRYDVVFDGGTIEPPRVSWRPCLLSPGPRRDM